MLRTRLPLVATLISAIFIASFLPANSASIAGTSCTKLNSTKTVSNIKYTCVKSGKKLAWNKGVSIVSNGNKGSTLNSGPEVKEFDSCSKLGERTKFLDNLYECRRILENKLVWIQIHSILPSSISNIDSPEPISTCQLKDHRSQKLLNWPEIAYPAVPAPGFTTKGTFKIVVVGIDFPDVRGEGKPSDIWQSDITKSKEFIDWYTSGQVKYDFVLSDKWLHASMPSKSFNANTESVVTGDQLEAGGMTPNQIATNYLNLIGKDVDISNTTAVWIYYPKNINDITGQWTSQLAGPIKTEKYGTVNTFVAAVGKETYESKREIWGYFLHEMLHRHGLFGHSPKIPYLTGMMSTFNGWTDALLPWDALVEDWQKKGDYFCLDNNKNFEPIQITLVPLEREQSGFRAVLIKLSDSKLLVIDSHRRDKWSPNTMPGQYGLMLNLVDTSKSSDFAVGDSGNSPSTSEYIKIDGVNHGQHQYFYYGVQDTGNGISNDLDVSGQVWWIDLNYFMYLGESTIYQNLKISMIKTGDNDTVRIERI